MRATPPGEVHLLSRRLPGAHDPVALFAALQGEGRATMLFRRTDGVALILVDRALKLEATAREARLEATSENGEALLDRVAAACANHRCEDGTFRFPPCLADAEDERIAAPSPLDLLRAMTALDCADGDEPFALTALGIIGFDHVDMAEQLPPRPTGDFPDLHMVLAETMVVIELSGATRLLAIAAGHERTEQAHRLHHLASERLSRLAARVGQARPPALAPAPATQAKADIDDDRFAATVERLKEHIAAGDIFQAVPSRTFAAPCADPLAAFRRLVAADPSAYHFYLETDHGTLFGASPETAITVSPGVDGKRLSVSPIAGTRPRGVTPDADDRAEVELRLDAKEAAEHLMLVDLARNDVARIAAPGTRRVTSLMRVERFARVMHIVSTVEGRLAAGRDAIHAIRACLNVGTLSGAPKLRATELIREVEETARGPYGGTVGYLTGRGAMDSAVVIRSALVRGGEAGVRAGAGVVADSDPAAEAAETRAKASAVLAALGATA